MPNTGDLRPLLITDGIIGLAVSETRHVGGGVQVHVKSITRGLWLLEQGLGTI